MIANSILLAVKGFLLLFLLGNQNIATAQVRSRAIECQEEYIQHWHGFYWHNVKKTGIKCYVQCSPACTCSLDDLKVTRNCTSSNVTISPVIYPSDDIRYLNWNNSVLHDIKPGAFLRFGSSLRSLHLANVSLHLQPGTFAGLTGLQLLDLQFNELDELLPGVFQDLFKLIFLDLNENKLSEIEVGVFGELMELEILHLRNNMINRIAEGAFKDLVKLKHLSLFENRLSKINAGVFIGLVQLKILNLSYNRLTEINAGVFKELKQLEHLHLHDNSLNTIPDGTLQNLVQLENLTLFSNKLSGINTGVFKGLINLKRLYLMNNSLSWIEEGAFADLKQLTLLVLYNNSLTEIDAGVFGGLIQLEALYLHNNGLNKISDGAFEHLVQLQLLDMRENPLLWIVKKSLAGLKENVSLVVTDNATCCFTSANCESLTPPKSPYLTCERLLPYNVLRIAMWFVCSFAIIGNIFVLYTRFSNKRQINKIQFLLITNLSISDFLMGVYLIILLSTDLYYKEYFPSHSESWRHSMLCRVAGAFSVLSSEASAFFITLITIDRFLGIKYTFSKFRPGSKSTRIIVILLWIIAFSISIAVFILSRKDSDAYAPSEICVGLPISRIHFYSTSEGDLYHYLPDPFDLNRVEIEKTSSKVGMIFSIALFTGLNLVCFLIIGYCYFAIFIYVRQTAQKAGRSPNLNNEIHMAMKIFLIVFTDFCCWVPIGILSILTLAGVVEVHPVAYAWIATFVLPINSSLNPFLYTLASFISDKVESSLKEESKDKTAKDHMLMRATSESENRIVQA